MRTKIFTKWIPLITLILALVANPKSAFSSHSEGADITYKCLGGNQYELTLSFYRDCHGVSAPSVPAVNCSSVSTNQNFDVNLQPIPGTGQEITLICTNYLTECSGGIYPGVQEWIYKVIVTLSPATDWVFAFDYCCRNAAITTIVNPGGQNIHIESTLDNLNFPCNSSPVFSTKPIPFVCLNQNYSFNHGAGDPDGDFISYELITPMNGYGTIVTYLLPYTATQPLSSTPAMQFDTLTGDVSMFPTALEVTIFAVKVKHWRNNQLVGYVVRDIQLRTMNCSNSYPYSFGINGNGNYISSACVGSPLIFNIYTDDPDTTQVLTLTWNNGIPGASFTVAGSPHPVGTFSWIPTSNDIGTHCFTYTITDSNCPINGSVTYAICLMVSGFDVQVTTTGANCGASNGTALATVTGGTPPYNYQWMPCGCVNNPLNGLQAGAYTVIVTDSRGCKGSDTGTVAIGSAPGNIIMNSTPESCFGANNGTASANANGGQPPYSYVWSNGQTTQTITGLPAGNYVVIVTTSQGCVKTDSIIVTQPSLLTTSVSHQDALCFGQSTGWATAVASGGTPPYNYSWSNGQSTQMISGLVSGNYFVTATDAKGCTSIQNVFIDQPAPLVLSIFSVTNPLCFGGSNGTAMAVTYGGIAPYTYLWNNGQTSQTATGLASGNYIVTVLDSAGCTSITAINIFDPSPLASSVTSIPAQCFGTNSGSASVSVSGGSGPYSYLWNNGQSGSTATSLSSGSYTVVVTDAHGCTQINSIAITQPAQLVSNVNTTQNVSCNGGSNGSAYVTVSGGNSPYTYQWTNGSSASVASGLTAGSYSVVIIDANGCKVANTITISQPNTILVSTSPDDTTCPGIISIINASAAGGTPPFTYFWQPNVGFGNAQAVNPNVTTTYTAVITDANGCTSTNTTTIHVYGMSITASLNATPSICIGQTATLTSFVTGANITSYYWSNNLGNGTGPFIVAPTTTTTYSVIVTNVCGATAIAMATISVHPIPQIHLMPQTAVACDLVQFQFLDTNTANVGGHYFWTFGDGGTSNQANPSHNYNQSGSYSITVTITSQYGCSSSAQTFCNAVVIPSPTANFTSDPPLETSLVNPEFRFFDQSTNATSWSWEFGDGQTSILQNPHHLYAHVGIYKVKLVTQNAGFCIDSIIKTVEVKPEFTFYVPNTFTPNGDGENEIFNGKGMEIIEFEMRIFDRWGNEIFQTNDLHKGWDGRANEGLEIAQQDVYVYQIKLRDFEKVEHNYTGHVNLVK